MQHEYEGKQSRLYISSRQHGQKHLLNYTLEAHRRHDMTGKKQRRKSQTSPARQALRHPAVIGTSTCRENTIGFFVDTPSTLAVVDEDYTMVGKPHALAWAVAHDSV